MKLSHVFELGVEIGCASGNDTARTDAALVGVIEVISQKLV